MNQGIQNTQTEIAMLANRKTDISTTAVQNAQTEIAMLVNRKSDISTEAAQNTLFEMSFITPEEVRSYREQDNKFRAQLLHDYNLC
jgi:hypothetical protein